MSFEQRAWLKPYIELNTELRRQATTTFERNFFKLLNNACYGKTMENLRHRVDIRLVSDRQVGERLVAKSNFDCSTRINDDLAQIKLNVTKILWNKPTYVGFCVLDLSKLHMYRFHYDVIKPLYEGRVKLLFTDTDSLCYELQTADVFEDLKGISDHLDTSDYPENHPLFSRRNAKVIGKFKDECNGASPIQFVGLRSKMYSLLLPGDKVKMTAKGLKTSTVRKHVVHRDYYNCLVDSVSTSLTYHNIRSRNHVLATEEITKRELSQFDDKRFLRPDTFDTFDTWAHGHYRIGRAQVPQ
jgi:hypothetical protein